MWAMETLVVIMASIIITEVLVGNIHHCSLSCLNGPFYGDGTGCGSGHWCHLWRLCPMTIWCSILCCSLSYWGVPGFHLNWWKWRVQFQLCLTLASSHWFCWASSLWYMTIGSQSDPFFLLAFQRPDLPGFLTGILLQGPLMVLTKTSVDWLPASLWWSALHSSLS